MNWYVGQKVVCVEAGTSLFPGASYADRTLVLGRIYTINGIKESCCGGGVNLLVQGGGSTSCPMCLMSLGGHWKHERRFRPLDTLTETIERIEKEGAPVELQPQYA